MPAPLRLLFLSDPAAASQAVGLIEQHSPVEASLATDASMLLTALRDERWDGVLVIPGGAVSDLDIARIYAGTADAPPLLVVGAKAPEVLRTAGASTVALGALGALAALLRTVLASRIPIFHVPPASPPASPAPPSPAPSPSGTSTESRVFEMPMSTPGASDALVNERPVSQRDSAEHDATENMADYLPIGVYRSTPDGRMLYANPAMARILGMSTVEQAGHLDVRWDLDYPRDTFEARIREDGEVRNLVVSWRHPSGCIVHTRENARIVRNARGRILYYEGTLEDVTEEIESTARERLRTRQFAAAVSFYDAAEAARTTADLHRDALKAFGEAFEADWAMIVRPFNGRNRIVAQRGVPGPIVSAMEALDLFASAAIPLRTTLLRSLDSPHSLPEPILDLMRQAGLASCGGFPLLRNGRPLGAILVGYRNAHTFSPEEVQGGEMLAWHLAGYLARRMTEQSLEDTEATLQFVAEHTGHALYRRRVTGEFDYLSPVIESLTGYTAREIREMGGWDALVVGARSGPQADLPSESTALIPIRHRSGDVRWIENTASAWCDASGHRIGIVGVLHDATDRKRYEDAQVEQAQRALARQEALVELATLGTGSEIADLVMQRAVEVTCLATGTAHVSIWLPEQGQITCRAHHPQGAEPGPYRMEAFDGVVQSMAGQRALAIADIHADERAKRLGLTDFASASGTTGLLIAPIRQASKVIGGLVLQRRAEVPEPWSEADIAFAAAVADALALTLERQKRADAQQALEASEIRYRTLAELTSDYAFAVVAGADGHGPIAWATDAFARISGYTPQEIGTTHELADILHPDSVRTVCAAYATLKTTGVVDFEACIVTRDEQTRWVHHRARLSTDGQGMVYHSGEDVTERKHFETELVDARERAEAMGRLKSAFLANMSHEIRTPLTSILGYSDLLLDELEADQRDSVLHIARSGVRLLDTLNSVLDLARLEADGVELQVRPLTVADHVESAIEPYRREAEQAGLGFHVDTDPTIQAELDPACFQRIVTNLVGNAVKFTEAGGVAVQVEADATHVYLHVRDTGVGMDEAFLENLFTDFQQESIGHNRSYEGTGLGMSITKRYVDLLGGRIDVETQKGVGTSFVVSFPLVWVPSTRPIEDVASGEPGSESSLDDNARAEGSKWPGDGDLESVLDAVESNPAAVGTALQQPESNDPIRPLQAMASDLNPNDTSGLGFEYPTAPADTSSAIADFVSPFPGSPQRPDHPVSHDPSLPTDMFFNRPEKTPDAADVSGEPVAPSAETSAPAAPAPVFPPEPPSMIVRGPASMPPPQAPPAWPTAPSAPAAAATPVPEAPPASPMAPPHPAAPMAPPASPAAPTTPAVPSAASSDEDRPALLVVEDNDDTRMLLDRILRSSYTVTAVGDARSALIEMNRNQFVGLVLDINLGGKETGADILRIARTLDGYKDVFAIALTAYALPGDRERLLEAGFNEYISKPFTRHSLMEALKEGLAH